LRQAKTSQSNIVSRSFSLIFISEISIMSPNHPKSPDAHHLELGTYYQSPTTMAPPSSPAPISRSSSDSSSSVSSSSSLSSTTTISPDNLTVQLLARLDTQSYTNALAMDAASLSSKFLLPHDFPWARFRRYYDKEAVPPSTETFVEKDLPFDIDELHFIRIG
jgi:hypothetical protein